MDFQEIPDIKRQIDDITERMRRAGLRVDLIDSMPCLSSPNGQVEFRAALPAWRVLLRNGRWRPLRALAICWAGYWLGRAITALGVPQAWRELRAK